LSFSPNKLCRFPFLVAGSLNEYLHFGGSSGLIILAFLTLLPAVGLVIGLVIVVDVEGRRAF
jgi:hypothetical protein